MLLARKLRDLTLLATGDPDRPSFLSAASSLVAVQSFLYVVADDELHLGVFPAHGKKRGELIRLLDGKLPEGKKKRKRVKPDFEAQVLLPPFGSHLHGALLALGSGSKGNRQTAVLLSLGAAGAVTGKPRVIDLSALWSSIEKSLGELNIEGAIVMDGHLVLLQRGNKGKAVNALVSLNLKDFLRALQAGDALGAMPFHLRVCDLGSTGGIPWGFTDACTLPDGRIAFTAVAEDTRDSVSDGPCAGAGVGLIARGRIVRFEELQPTIKAEGIEARIIHDHVELLLVTDADDASIPAGLWAAELK